MRLDQFARNPRLMDLVAGSSYDLAVIDEAHKLTARTWGNKLIKSKRFEFGERLRDLCPNLLLMTATPHNGKEDGLPAVPLAAPRGRAARSTSPTRRAPA